MAQEARAASQVNSVPEVTEAAAASEPVTKEIPATQEPELPTKETPFTQQPPQTSEGDSRTKKKSPGKPWALADFAKKLASGKGPKEEAALPAQEGRRKERQREVKECGMTGAKKERVATEVNWFI